MLTLLRPRLGRKNLQTPPQELGGRVCVSHRLCYERIVSSKVEVGLIFEDDNQMNVSNAFEIVNNYRYYLSSAARSGQAFVCNLGMPPNLSKSMKYRRVYFKSLSCDSGLRRYVDTVHRVWRANAYLISKAAMGRILEREPSVSLLADDWSARLLNRTLDAIYYPQFALFRQNENLVTTVQNGTALPASNALAYGEPKKLMHSMIFRALRYRARLVACLPVILREDEI